MERNIRPAQPQDAAGLAAVHVQSWKETYAGLLPETFLRRMTDEAMCLKREERWSKLLLDPSQMTYVAIADGIVVGFVNAGPMREDPQFNAAGSHSYDAEINAIYLLRAVQGSGVGRALFHAAVGALRDQGFRSVALWVLKGNPTCGFYKHLGGEEDGEKRVAIPEGELHEVRFGWHDLSQLS